MGHAQRKSSGWFGLGEKERRDSDIRHLVGVHPCLTTEIQTILDALPTPALAWDVVPGGGYRLAAINDLYAAATGQTAVVGCAPEEIFSRNAAEQVQLHITQAVAEKLAQTFELEVNLPTGRGWWKLSVRPVRNATGQCVRVMCTAIDITGEKLAENALVQQRDEMRHLALTDPGTGLHNKRAFMQYAVGEIGRARRYDRPLSLLLFDVDQFKRVNDTLGHSAGDAALEAVAGACQQLLRTSDLCARIGGDEFALVLPETSLEDARIVAERLRQHLDEATVSSDTVSMPIRISIGATHLMPTDDISSLVGRADDALYNQKSAGGNGTTVSYM